MPFSLYLPHYPNSVRRQMIDLQIALGVREAGEVDFVARRPLAACGSLPPMHGRSIFQWSNG
jgi:hypothetical protein